MGLSSEDIRLRVELGFRIKFHIKISRDFPIGELKKFIDTILRENYQMRIPSYTICTQDGFEVLEILRVGEILEDGQRIHIDPFGSGGCFSLSCSEQLGYDMLKPAALPKESNIENLSNRAGGVPKKSISKRVGTERKKPSKDTRINGRKGVSNPLCTTSKDEPTNIQSISTAATKAMVEGNDLKNSENAHNKDEKANSEKSALRASEDDARPEAACMSESTGIQDKLIDVVDKKSSEALASTSQPPKPDNFKGFIVRKLDLTKNESSKFEEQGFFKPLKKRKAEENAFEII